MDDKLTVFVGGSVGSDPESPKTWSGACVLLLRALDDARLLDRAFGVRLPRMHDVLLRLKNFHPDRARWRSRYYFDLAYRQALTRAAGRIPCQGNTLLQIGHMFCLPQVFSRQMCISYHDGNLAEKLKSGFGLKGQSAKRIDAVLRYEEETAGQMTAIFTFSQYLRQSFISDYHVPSHRVFCVGSGINLASEITLAVHKDYSTPQILFVGVEFGRKGGPQLLEAFRRVRHRIPKAELHIVGPHSTPELPPGVVFHGHLSKSIPAQKAKLESLYRTSTLFVLPSLYEPFGIAPLEAMLYEVPCIVTDAWAFRETVLPGVNGERVAKGDIENLAETMIRVLNDPDSLSAMGRRGREMVLRDHTWKAVAGRFVQALSAIECERADRTAALVPAESLKTEDVILASGRRN